MSHIVIIGGGIAGLASAALLSREGHEVTLLEAREQLGGRAGSWEQEGFRFDTGPSWYLMPDAFDHFYRLLGTSAEEQLKLVTLDPGFRVYFEGRSESIEIGAGIEDNIELFESMERGAGERLRGYLQSARQTYELVKARFLYTTFASIRKSAKSYLGSRTGEVLELLSSPLHWLVARTVRNPRLRQVLEYPALFLGTSPYATPSMYHHLSQPDLTDGVLYPMGGFARVIESVADLARAEGATLLLRADVQRILVEHGSAVGVEYLDEHGHVQFVDADLVVSAADLHHTETKLLRPSERSYPERYWAYRVPGPSALLLYLGVRGELPQLEHHTLLLAKHWKRGFRDIFGPEPRTPDPASLYLCKPSGVDPDVAPEGFENLVALVPVPADPTIGRGGDPAVETLADRVIRQIADWTGIDDLAERIVVRRTVGPRDFAEQFHAWRGTAFGPAHIHSQNAFLRAGNVSRKVRGLYYVGSSTTPGVSLPMCLISAELLVKRLRRDTSTEPLPEPL